VREPEALGLSTEQWVQQRLGGYVKLAVEDRREAVAELTDQGHSQREIGEVLGVSQMTVSRDLAPETNDSESPPEGVTSETNVSPVDAVATLAADEKLRAQAVTESNRAIAAERGVSYETVRTARKATDPNGSVDQPRIGRDGIEARVGQLLGEPRAMAECGRGHKTPYSGKELNNRTIREFRIRRRA
jgi:DNA-binding CsgD family transcriptional regulator